MPQPLLNELRKNEWTEGTNPTALRVWARARIGPRARAFVHARVCECVCACARVLPARAGPLESRGVAPVTSPAAARRRQSLDFDRAPVELRPASKRPGPRKGGDLV